MSIEEKDNSKKIYEKICSIWGTIVFLYLITGILFFGGLVSAGHLLNAGFWNKAFSFVVTVFLWLPLLIVENWNIW